MTGRLAPLTLLLVMCSPISWADPGVERGQFTTAVIEREPVDTIERLELGAGHIMFFSELIELQGQTITHRWMHDGEIMAEVSFDVGGDRWRVWSSKRLLSLWEGVWTVHVLDGTGAVLAEYKFTYAAPAAV